MKQKKVAKILSKIQKSENKNKDFIDFMNNWIPPNCMNDVDTENGKVLITDSDGDKHRIPLRLYIMLCMLYDGGAIMLNSDFDKYSKTVMSILTKMYSVLKSNTRKSQSLAKDIDLLGKKQKGFMAATGFSWIIRFIGLGGD